MNFRHEESVRNSLILIVSAVFCVYAAFSLVQSKIWGVIVAFFIVTILEYNRSKCSKAVYKMVFVDDVTGLPNQEQMKQVLEDRIKTREGFILAVFDVKNFKIINDLWGYEVGDRYLRFIGDKVKAFSDIFDFACRMENDNFAVVYKNSSAAMAMEVIETLFQEINVLPDKDNYHVQFSAGIVQQDGNYKDSIEMLDCAKIAKANAKKSNQTKIVVYDEETKNEMIRQQNLKDNLHEGLKNDEFVVYLQPKYNVKDNTLAGAEALIRWNFKHERFMSPGLFVPVFEEDGSIELLDRFVLLKVADKFVEWIEKGYVLHPISVNVSRVQLANQNLVNEIAQAVSERGVPFEYIDLELTESAAFEDMDRLLSIMNDIKRKGFKLSMDDFGTGYSSLGLLRKMPLDILKLDKSFVDAYVDESCEKERYIICDIINMAHHLGITVLAEGVENKAQHDLLYDAGCEIIQGYYYSKPIPIEEYEELLKKEQQRVEADSQDVAVTKEESEKSSEEQRETEADSREVDVTKEACEKNSEEHQGDSENKEKSQGDKE